MPALFPNGTNAKFKAAFADESSFGSVLFLAALAHYGNEMVGADDEPMWSPETILYHIEDDFGIKMPQGCFDRMMAMMTVTLTDMFNQDLPTFIHICNVLSGSPITEEFDPANVLEMSWAVTEANLVNLDPTDESEFHPDIVAYIAEACKEEGVMVPPPVLAKIVGAQLPEMSMGGFADDPELFQAAWYNQKVHAIENQIAVDSNIWKLYQQFRILSEAPEVQKKLTELQNKVAVSIQEKRKKLAELGPS